MGKSKKAAKKSVAKANKKKPLASNKKSSTRKSTNPGAKASKKSPLASNIRRATPPPPTDHIPPTKVGGNSFYIENYHQLGMDTSSAGPTERPRIYDPKPDPQQQIDLNAYGSIAEVQIYIEFKKEIVLSYSPRFQLQVNPQLRLWFQVWNGRDFDPIPPNSPCHVLIKGGPPLVTEIEQRFGTVDTLSGPQPTHNIHRRYRHSHMGRNADFRIGKWRITDSNGNTIRGLEGSLDTTRDGDNEPAVAYTFFISYHHQE